MSKTLTTILGSLAGGLAGAGGIAAAISSVSTAAPAAFVPYAATQVGLGALGVTSALGGAAATSSTVALVGGPLVVASSAVAIPAVTAGGIAYGLYKIFSK